MKTKTLSAAAIQKMVDEQVRKWDIMGRDRKKKIAPVITISRQAGSPGRPLAQAIAKELKLDIYGSRIIDEVAKSAKMSGAVVASLDEKGRSMLDDWISILETDRSLWSYQYLKHLVKVILTIGRHGNAVILGRGAHLILPPEGVLRVRVIASLEERIKNVMAEIGCSRDEARGRIITVDAGRKAFIRKYFHADIDDPAHYDLVINAARIPVEKAVDMIKIAWR